MVLIWSFNANSLHPELMSTGKDVPYDYVFGAPREIPPQHISSVKLTSAPIRHLCDGITNATNRQKTLILTLYMSGSHAYV